ncbi:hypothetical protein B0T14DRAFT_495427 [Immersiella caudata]|uniref:RING-type domain-containing protein n=1 Tax=Immersiella caudata TaxID=314043 RepID=A0AA39WZ88_9PEZI|nr:hypothetical protein B0T14DRAFT_495427 [Immersiella caudata]
MAIVELDPLTLNLALQMQLEDLEELAQNMHGKGKSREGEVPDSVAAIEAYRHELSGYAQFLSDKIMCQSIVHAVDMDGDAIRALVADEERAIADREMALLVSGAKKPCPSAADGSPAPTPSFAWRMLDMTKTLSFRPRGHDAGEPKTPAESSDWAASRPFEEAMSTCLVCRDEFRSIKGVNCVGCAHAYCPDCLESLFRASITDESRSGQSSLPL